MKYLQRSTTKPSVYCILLQGLDIYGKKLYSYVAVHSDKLDSFKRLAKTPNFFPDKIGKIIFVGKGELTPEMHEFILENYIRSENVEILSN